MAQYNAHYTGEISGQDPAIERIVTEQNDEQIAAIEGRIRMWKKEDPAVQALSAIPGVGLLTATAAVAVMGNAKTFRAGREFAVWAGLMPKQTGSSGKITLHGISKRSDTYLRTLLIHRVRSVVMNTKALGPRLEQIKKRRPHNVVVVALANKMVRTVWACLRTAGSIRRISSA